MSCIIGAIMYCTATMHISGRLGYAQTYLGNEAWRYAAYYGPPVTSPWRPVVTVAPVRPG
jgi:hypothetical protein